jgi:mannose-6-phosphate isomerase-like protein (cupin superfamily)
MESGPAAMARGAALVLLVAGAACEKERVATVMGPPLIAAPPAAPTRPATLDLVEVRGKSLQGPPRTESITLRPCEEILVAGVSARATVLGETLDEGDALVAVGQGTLEIATSLPSARVAVARVVPTAPCGSSGPLAKQVVRASAAPELTWAGGTMHAHLDVEKNLSPVAYLGRLSGSAPVAEHTHPDSWELICAIEASGTFRIRGEDTRMRAGQCAAVPPGDKHQWTPDPGTSLTAVQVYVPPGPEQRFRALAAAAAAPDGGT